MQFDKGVNFGVALSGLLILAGCGGSSGGPGGPGGRSFVGFSQMKDNSTTTVGGIGRGATVSLQNGMVSDSPAFTSTAAVSADIGLDGNGNVTEATVRTPTGTETWNGSNSTLDRDGGLLIATRNNGSGQLAAADPSETGFEYQTFGAWTSVNQAGTQAQAGCSALDLRRRPPTCRQPVPRRLPVMLAVSMSIPLATRIS